MSIPNALFGCWKMKRKQLGFSLLLWLSHLSLSFTMLMHVCLMIVCLVAMEKCWKGICVLKLEMVVGGASLYHWNLFFFIVIVGIQ